jgi:hypothetical protein
MKYPILIISLILVSCSTKWNGTYLDSTQSDVKHLKQSILSIENELFELETNSTNLDYWPGSDNITTITGNLEHNRTYIKLYPRKESYSQVAYGKPIKSNPEYSESDSIPKIVDLDQPKLRGTRVDAYIAIDTIQGKFNLIDNCEPITLEIIKYPNSIYFVNTQYCFMKYHDINLQNNKDMTNYCGTIQSNYGQ